MKILLIAGHGAGDPGACSNYGLEATETRRVVNMLKSQFGGYELTVDIYPIDRNAYSDIENGCLQVNFANYDYILEVHFNSAANIEATGVEVWVTQIENGITVEQSIVNKVSALGYSNRGVKREDFRVIRTAKNRGVSAALIEICFISNEGDMNRYNNNFYKVCNAIVKGVSEGFGINKKSGYAEPTQQPQPTHTEKPKVNYFVKTKDGKQLGAFNVLEYAKDMASKNKAIIYDKSNEVVVSYVLQENTGKRYDENGTYYFNTAVTVRIAPEENAKTDVVYYPGESVIYHHVILNKNGFNWIEYERNNGTTGYLKVKDLTTDESYGYAK